MKPPAQARVIAAAVLERVARDGAFADVVLEHELARVPLAPRDAALATELVYGTLRWQRHLDWLLAPYSRRALATLDASVLVSIRLAAYQIRFLDRIPAFAAVNDAVTLARRRDRPAVGAFVNAVLRAFTSAGGREPPLPADPVEALGVTLSFPDWLAKRWVARWGTEEAALLMRAMNERPPLTIRTNTLRTEREALAARLLREEAVEARPTRFAPEGLTVTHGGMPGAWHAFVAGELAVQDEASMLVARLLAPRAGDLVVDACAAPGTKTTHLAQLMGDRGHIVAFDPQPARLPRVREAATRLGVTIIQTVEGPVESLAGSFRGACDGVLVDAPCSNLGVLRRNPEVKWRRAPGELAGNASRQRAILAAAATMVKRGGRLVYATCSVEPEENDEVARDFLGAHPDFRVDAPGDFPIPLDDAGILRCLPHRHGTDGFTAIRFARAAAD